MSQKDMRYTSGAISFFKLLEASPISLCSVCHLMSSSYLQSQKKYIFLWKYIYIFLWKCIRKDIQGKCIKNCWDCEDKD